jgi:RHS repeat-associated protein
VRTFGIFIASVLLITGINIQPAYAEENVDQAPDIPTTQLTQTPEVTSTQLTSDQTSKNSNADTVTLTATTNEDVSKSDDTVSIVDKDTDKTVASCDTGTTCTYEYKKQDYTSDKTFFARTAKTSSATVQVVNDVPYIFLYTTLEEADSEDMFYLYMGSQGTLPEGKSVYIVDDETKEILQTCNSLTCETDYLRINLADNKVYVAYLADSGANQFSELQNIITQSNTATVSHSPWLLTTSIDNAVVDEGSIFSLKANLNQAITQDLSIYFYNVTTGKIVDEGPEDDGYCVSAYTTSECKTSFAYDTSQQYKAVLANKDDSLDKDSVYRDFTNIKAVSNTITVKQLPWSGTFHTDEVWGFTDHAYVAGINQRTTYYYSAFVNPTTGSIYEICWFSDSCSTDPDKLTDADVQKDGLKFVIGRWSGQSVGLPQDTHNPGGQMYDIQKEVIWKSPGSTSANDSNGTEQKGGPNKSEKCENTCGGDPINLVTGEFWLEQNDLEIGSSVPLQFTRYYNVSKKTSKGSLGYGWNNQYDFALKPVTGTSLSTANAIAVAQENGSTSTFTKNSSGMWTAGVKTQASLVQTSTGYSFIRGKATTFNFNTTGQLTDIVDLNGNKITLTYASGKISKVANNKGQSLTVAWNTSNLISSVKTNGGRTVKYAYSTGGDLKTVTYANNTTRKYNYIAHAVTSMTDPNGGVTTNEYDEANRVTTQTDANSGLLQIEYKAGQTVVTQPTGAVQRHYFNELGQVYRIEKERDYAGSYNEYYEFDEANNVTTISYQDGGTVQKTYDVNGNVTQLKDRAGNVTAYTYDNTNHVLSETNAYNKTQTYTYDTNSNLVEHKDFNGNISKYEANTDGTVKKITSANQAITLYAYTAAGLPTTITDANNKVETKTYTAEGELKTATDADNNLTSYAYDAVGNIASITYPNGYTKTFIYDGNGNTITATDRKGNVTSTEYDELNRPVKQTDANGNVTTTEYDGVDNVTKTTDAENNVSSYEYNGLNQVVSSTDERNNTSTYEYDIVGNLTQSIDANGNVTRYNYDANNNLIRTISPNKVRTETTYDSLNRVVTSIDSQRQKTSYTYDGNSNVLTTTYPDNTLETTAYDTMDQRTTFTDTEGKQKSWTYTTTGQLSTATDIDGKITKYAYTPGENLQTVTRPDNTVVTYAYNAGQLNSEKYSDATFSYTYDANGSIETETTNGVTTTYTYDAVGNVLSRGSNSANELDYTYTPNNQVANLQYPSGEMASYTYDETGNLKSVETPTVGRFEYAYNANNQVTELTYPNGVNQTFEYNADSQQTHNAIGNLWDKKYNYNSNSGLLTSSSLVLNEPTEQTIDNSYTYDNKSRLTGVNSEQMTSGSYSYSDSGNLVSNLNNAQTYNQSNQLTSANGKTYDYDQRGNRLQSKNAVGQVAEQYTYNQSDKLTTAKIGTTSVQYQYDTNGLLSQRKTGTTAKTFVWDYTDSVQKLLDDSDYQYIYGAGEAPLAQTKHSNQVTTYLYADSLGSVVAATDSSGAQKAAYNYDAYGKIESSGTTEATHITTRFGYAGEWADPTTGLYNLRARWYDNNVGVLLSKDPLEDMTNSPYSYGSANPLLYTDPSGNISVMTPGIWSSPQTGFGVADETSFGISTQYLNDKMPGMIDVCDGGFAIGKYGTLGVSLFAPGGGLKLGKFVKWDGRFAKVFKSSRGSMGGEKFERRTIEEAMKYSTDKAFQKKWNATANAVRTRKGDVPDSIVRLDSGAKARGSHREIPQIHFSDGFALYVNGEVKHGTRDALTNTEKKYLKKQGITIEGWT